LQIIEASVIQLEKEQVAAGKGDLFQLLRPRLDPTQAGSGSDAELATRLGMSHDSVRQAISRLRKRFREIMRSVVASTLNDPSEEALTEELASLREALVG
jgi:RNA polymerase sigma-70 factor (ECF subfamily)